MSTERQIVPRSADNREVVREELSGEIRVSVRSLVEFILRQGDIDHRRQGFPENAMQEGSRIHRMIQKRMGADYQAEVSLRYTCPTENYRLVVEGRADGIIPLPQGALIDEIKGTYRDLSKMKGPVPVHVAQAKCYAYMYGLEKGAEELQVRMTYCNLETEEIRYFYEDYTFRELEEWFRDLIAAYRKWADYSWEWQIRRRESIASLEFPFPYREGQKELVTYVYQTIYHRRKLFLEAPTGVGKTISTVFPAIQAMGRGMGNKLFYLTAKTITRTVAEDTMAILRGKGLRFKSVILTARDKICFQEKAECNPETCPYARGHYDRINDALFALLVQEESFTRECIERYARQFQVCPFEMCLDISLFADGVICDYNYLFDPHVCLKRFFGEGVTGDYLFLIDEAHNLLERGREMYSAVLLRESFPELSREIKKTIMSEMHRKDRKKEISGQMTLEMTEMSTEVTERSSARSALARKGYGEKMVYQLDACGRELLALRQEGEACRVVDSIDRFVNALLKLHGSMSGYLEEQETETLPVREQILDLYFQVSHFLDIYERLDEHYVKYTEAGEDGSFRLKLFCVNPRENLRECMQRGRSTILFSATFLPVQYYKELLGGEPEDYEVYARSVFQPEKRAVFVANDVTSKYSRRSGEEYYRIARYIDEIVSRLHGNYLVFCPSYVFLRQVYELYLRYFAAGDRECVIQGEMMSEEEREEFLDRFRGNPDCDLEAVIHMEIEEEEHTLIGFCVLGGIFGEGIDLKKDSLIGAIIVGTGLPQVCHEREILRNYFDEMGESGFDYAYRYPGMNKVLQAAGRVIRTAEDIGVIALLDERFLQPSYQRMFPREWTDIETVCVDTVGKRVERFWDSWL